MVLGVRVLKHIVAVVAAEAGQGFGFAQAVQLAEREDLAGAAVLAGGVADLAIAESGRRVVVVGVDRGEGVGEFDLLGRGPLTLEKGGQRHVGWGGEWPRSVAARRSGPARAPDCFRYAALPFGRRARPAATL